MKVVAAFVSNTLFNFVIGLLLARYLGPENYGRFAVALAVGVMVQTVAFDWARLAAARFYSEKTRAEDPKLRATLDLSLALIVLLLGLGALALVLSGLALPMSTGLAGLAIGVAVANGLFDYGTALLRARFLDGLYARLIIGKNALSMLLTVGGAFWFGSAEVALLGLALSMTGALAGVRRGLVDRLAPLRLAERRLAGTLVRYAIPIILANLFYQTIPLVDRLVIARQLGLAQSGQFSFAYDIGVRIVAAVGSMLDVLLFQIAVRADEIHGSHQGKRQVAQNIGIVVAVLAPACAGCWLVLPSFEAVAVPAEFRGPFASDLALLLPGLFCYGVIFFALHPLFQINRRTAPLVAVALGASAVNLLGLAVLPERADAAGFAVMQGLALAVAVAALVACAMRTAPVWPRARDLAGTAACTLVMVLVVQRLTVSEPGLVRLIVQAGAGVIVYGLAALLLDLCQIRTLIRSARLRR